MHCMKCGRELKEKQIFCPECLAVMAAYPIKPGTPILIPTRQNTPIPPAKSPKKKTRKPEERVLRLRSVVRWLTFALVVTLLAFIAAILMMLWLLDGPGWQPLF